jgi:hypothetical protein
MTQGAHKHEHKAHSPRKPRDVSGNRPWRTRLFSGVVVICCGLAATVMVFDRKDLPASVRDNVYVEKVYRERDAALSAGGAALKRHETPAAQPAAEDASAKQQGYTRDDRAQLDQLISKGAQNP